MTDLSGSRRDVLRRGAAAIGAATIAGSAGCMGILGGGGDSTQWLPAPGTLADDDHYSFSVSRLSSIAAHEDEFDDTESFEEYERQWAPADVDWDEVENLVSFNGVSVVEADFETDAVVSDFESDDYETDEEYEGFTLMLAASERWAVAVGDGTLLFTHGGYSETDGPVEAAKRVIDTKNGESDRYTTANEDLDEVMTELDGGENVFAYTRDPADDGERDRGAFENLAAWGNQTTIDGEESDGTWVWVYDTEADADVGAIEEWTASERSMFDDVEVTENGRVVVVEATAETADLYSDSA